MSAIAGIFHRNSHAIDKNQIKDMNNSLSYRGPDGGGIWSDANIALSHQNLFTSRESFNENLPFEFKDTIITSDARIDNREELSKILKIKDEVDVPDSFFIIKAYQKWGEECPEKLLGDFSFAIWDKNEEKLFCARDHMGVKPLYYFLSDDSFIFASEIKAILQNPDIERKINEIAIYYHLNNYYENREYTFYEDILRLPAAHQITVTQHDSRLIKYWELDPTKEIHLNSDYEYINTFKELFNEAVRCRLRSAFPLGSQLSGGLDSSSVVCTAINILKDRNESIKTFSAIFNRITLSDESKYIQEVVNNDNIEPYFLQGDEIPPLKELKKYLWREDEPFWIPNLFLSSALCRKAHANGVRVLLSGEDGDTTLSHGHGILKDLAINFRYLDLLREIKGMSIVIGYQAMLWSLLTELTPDFLKKIWYLIYGKGKLSTSTNIISHEFAKNVDITNMNLSKEYLDDNVSFSRNIHYKALNSGSIQAVFESFDSLAAAYKMELRYPFYDRRLVEFCLGLPVEQKLYNGWTRMILRRAMENILPPKIQWRKRKGNLGHNFDQSINLEQNYIKKVILNDKLKVSKYINLDELSRLYDQCLSRNFTNQYTIDKLMRNKIYCNSFNIWKLITLASWMEKFK